MMLTTHLCVVLRLRLSGPLLLHFLFAIIACTEITLPFTSSVFCIESAVYTFCTHYLRRFLVIHVGLTVGCDASEDTVIAHLLVKAALIVHDSDVNEDVPGNLFTAELLDV